MGANVTLSVLSHNVYFLPRIFFPKLEQVSRAKLIGASDYVKGHDVVIFEEVWDAVPRGILVNALKDQYPFRTEVLGQTEGHWDVTSGRSLHGLGASGGVLIMSKWPIVRRHQYIYSTACGADWFAHKGFAYVQLNYTGKPIHVVGTHMQSNDKMCARPNGSSVVRHAQLLEIRSYLDQLNIPSSEPIIIAGDLNTQRDTVEYRALLSTLRATPPTEWTGGSFTWDSAHNSIIINNPTNHDPPQYLDYILTITDNSTVLANVQRVHHTPASPGDDSDYPFYDYSDHYPIISTIKAFL
ncbi:hypothetical protein BGW41_002292 [Actinomortierella wolfii]|nr:hypothetical protein BGW41_002292 [Actinomortierella wolfii]